VGAEYLCHRVIFVEDAASAFTPLDPVILFVRTDRECSPVSTAVGRPEPGPVFARTDRSRRLRAIGIDERWGIGQGERLPLAMRGGAVRTDEHQFRQIVGAVITHKQVRSGLANKTSSATAKSLVSSIRSLAM